MCEHIAEQYRYEDDRQDLALGKSIDYGRRNDPEQEGYRAVGLGMADIGRDGGVIEARGVDVEACARAHQVGRQQAHDQRDGRENLEIQQRLRANAADLLQVVMPHIPDTTVQKITRPMIILIIFRNTSPRGPKASPVCGDSHPTATPAAIPNRTCTYSSVYQRRRVARTDCIMRSRFRIHHVPMLLTCSAMTSPTCCVLAVPPRSGVRGPLLSAASMEATTARAASGCPRCSSIIAPDQI